jgi:hypothetical protein
LSIPHVMTEFIDAEGKEKDRLSTSIAIPLAL